MTISEKKPEDVLEPEFIEEYKVLHNDICFRLSHINTTITILEKILQSPIQYFEQSQTIFWRTVCWNFVWISVILIRALVEDKHKKDKLTITKFRDNICDWLKDSEKEIYQMLKDYKFDQTTEIIKKNMKRIRDKELAHKEFRKNRFPNVNGITVSEIRHVYNDIENLFHACSFGVEYDTTLYPTGEFAGKPIEKDIEKLIDLVVKNSNWLNRPELMEEHWPDMRKDFEQEELHDLNIWRRKFGLSPP